MVHGQSRAWAGLTSADNEERLISNREEVRTLLPDPGPLEALKDKVRALNDDLEFGLVSRLLEKASARAPDDPGLGQQLAVCTHKDEEVLPASPREGPRDPGLRRRSSRSPAVTESL